jgi:hypothetical protein
MISGCFRLLQIVSFLNKLMKLHETTLKFETETS